MIDIDKYFTIIRNEYGFTQAVLFHGDELELIKEIKRQNKLVETLESKEFPKPNLKILNIFNANDRLDELDEVPKLGNGEIDYWLASKMLCEKDGGRLPTMKELAEIASYIYQNDFSDFEDKSDLELKNELIPLGNYWSSFEYSSTYAYRRYFDDVDSYWYRSYRAYGYRSLCIGD